MILYVNANAGRDGNGSKEMPFRRIGDAARIAQPGDEVLVAPGVYREYVDPQNAGTPDARITYRSEEPLGAVITGAEQIKSWKPYEGDVWVCRVDNGIFGSYNPYTTYVYGDWYFAGRSKHTGAVYLNDKALYEAASVEECLKAEVYPYSWEPEASRWKWYAEQDGGETVIYANFHGKNPNEENVEINVRRECFMPSKTGVGYITVSGFNINKAATTWAPPAAYQDGMIGPHWSKGWIIEDCEISNSKCAGISLGKYLDPDNDHYFTVKHVKSPTQMERDAVCRGQYHGWLKENVGSHIVRRCNIHNCEQGGIIGRMGAVFSVIEDNHIHHINNMMELGGAEIAGIKLHAAIDVIFRRNHIHNCTMGIWCDWEAQGTRITQNLLHDNQRPVLRQAAARRHDEHGHLRGGRPRPHPHRQQHPALRRLAAHRDAGHRHGAQPHLRRVHLRGRRHRHALHAVPHPAPHGGHGLHDDPARRRPLLQQHLCPEVAVRALRHPARQQRRTGRGQPRGRHACV